MVRSVVTTFPSMGSSSRSSCGRIVRRAVASSSTVVRTDVSPEITRRLAGAGRPVLASLVERYGPPPRRRPVHSSQRFAALAEIIVYQQLAGKAAATIHGRFEQALGGSVTPERVLAATPELLASAGLSRAKAASIRDLADKVVTGEVSLERIGRLSDDDVVDHLTQVRGIGPWTAHMFLLGTLGPARRVARRRLRGAGRLRRRLGSGRDPRPEGAGGPGRALQPLPEPGGLVLLAGARRPGRLVPTRTAGGAQSAFRQPRSNGSRQVLGAMRSGCSDGPQDPGG